MRATLEFNLPEDEEGLTIALEAGSVKAVLFAFEQALRSIRKYEEHADEVQQMVQRISDLFYDSLGEFL
jgi:truncated hemoglobin YjbI